MSFNENNDNGRSKDKSAEVNSNKNTNYKEEIYSVDFINNLRQSLISSLNSYQQYKIDFDPTTREEMKQNFDKLKEQNLIYFTRIKSNLKHLEKERNELLEDISVELSIKNRMRYAAIFYMCFYSASTILISNLLGISFPRFSILLAFLIVPNIIFYNKKIAVVKTRIEETLLKHSMSNIIIVKDRVLADNFIKDYLDYYSKNKLI